MVSAQSPRACGTLAVGLAFKRSIIRDCKRSLPPLLLNEGGNIAINKSLMLNRHRRRKLKNASTVDSKIILAMRPLSAPKCSASRATLLALGNAAASSG